MQTLQTSQKSSHIPNVAMYSFPTLHVSQMKRITQLPFADGTIAIRTCSRTPISTPFTRRCLHTTQPKSATVYPVTASGPPPSTPVASADHVDSRVARRRKQAELLQRGQDLRAVRSGSGSGTAKTKRFWKDVHVKHTDGRTLPYQAHI